ncbi:MAG: DUF2262 domain-containing protein [Lysinibacillus sp.]
MKKTISSESMGVFTFDELVQSYCLERERIRWGLDASPVQADADVLLKRAENLNACLKPFNQKAKKAIAERLVDYKNDCWPEYDEDDESLDWDAVDAGEYDVTQEGFEKAITLCYVQIGMDTIYCEYKDGDLFGGHRIHALFDHGYRLISAEV